MRRELAQRGRTVVHERFDRRQNIEQLVEIFANYDYRCEILVASVRNPVHFVTAARMGADVATCPFKVIEQLIKHPLTDIGLERFLADWDKAHKK